VMTPCNCKLLDKLSHRLRKASERTKKLHACTNSDMEKVTKEANRWRLNYLPPDFEGTTLKEKRTLLVLFTANWCPFCLMFNPVFRSTLNEKNTPYAVVNLTDFRNPLWERFQIEVVPNRPCVQGWRSGSSSRRETWQRAIEGRAAGSRP
jgi:thiol-disulfide isomerase/thioredoxin